SFRDAGRVLGVAPEVLREGLGRGARRCLDRAGDDAVAAREVGDELGDGPALEHARPRVVDVDVAEPHAQCAPLLADDLAGSGKVCVAHDPVPLVVGCSPLSTNSLMRASVERMVRGRTSRNKSRIGFHHGTDTVRSKATRVPPSGRVVNVVRTSCSGPSPSTRSTTWSGSALST